ncbi:MAG: AAA family ATPase [Dehalococcoidia bacterium]
MIGRRICVYGPSGSGKTTLARAIGERLGLPAIEFDAIHHLPNWEERPAEEFRAIVLETLDGYRDGWVTDGNYRRVRDLVLPLADTVVWLRLPFRVVYWQLFRRTMTRSWRRQELWSGNRETFGKAFFSRDSILLWGLTHYNAHFRNIAATLEQVPHNAEVIELRSSREVDDFVASLAAERTATAAWTK